MSTRFLRILDEDEDDPMLSAVNLVDVFLVVVVALLVALVDSTRRATPAESARIRDAGSPQMEMIVTESGEQIRYKGTGSMSEGKGVRAGVAYRLRDGSIIYVPETTGSDHP
jgi:hypothetical protein